MQTNCEIRKGEHVNRKSKHRPRKKDNKPQRSFLIGKTKFNFIPFSEGKKHCVPYSSKNSTISKEYTKHTPVLWNIMVFLDTCIETQLLMKVFYQNDINIATFLRRNWPSQFYNIDECFFSKKPIKWFKICPRVQMMTYSTFQNRTYSNISSTIRAIGK